VDGPASFAVIDVSQNGRVNLYFVAPRLYCASLAARLVFPSSLD
jgi:hypothetical protein